MRDNEVDLEEARKILALHYLLVIDRGWPLVHLSATEGKFNQHRRAFNEALRRDPDSSNIKDLVDELDGMVGAGWDYVFSPFVSDRAKSVFTDARRAIETYRGLIKIAPKPRN